MSAISRRLRPVAIALVLQDDNGTMHIVGSKSVDQFVIEMNREASPSPFLDGQWLPGRASYRFEAECSSAIWQSAGYAPAPQQIEQRGIYLPDMSFRALPAPDESK